MIVHSLILVLIHKIIRHILSKPFNLLQYDLIFYNIIVYNLLEVNVAILLMHPYRRKEILQY